MQHKGSSGCFTTVASPLSKVHARSQRALSDGKRCTPGMLGWWVLFRDGIRSHLSVVARCSHSRRPCATSLSTVYKTCLSRRFCGRRTYTHACHRSCFPYTGQCCRDKSGGRESTTGFTMGFMQDVLCTVGSSKIGSIFLLYAHSVTVPTSLKINCYIPEQCTLQTWSIMVVVIHMFRTYCETLRPGRFLWSSSRAHGRGTRGQNHDACKCSGQRLMFRSRKSSLSSMETHLLVFSITEKLRTKTASTSVHAVVKTIGTKCRFHVVDVKMSEPSYSIVH